jgi:L-ascorbate metabolism protein UlaG (beta-lactamase superfamily)
MKLKYYRHATFLLQINKTKILVDPMYMKKGRMPPVPSTLNLHRNPLKSFPGNYPTMTYDDVVLITHHHFDHFDRTAAKELPKHLLVISPVNGIKRLRRMGFERIIPIHQDQEFVAKNFRIHGLPVKHAQRLEKMLYKPGLGYLIQFSKGTVYVSGDTILFDAITDRLERFPIDLAIFYAGAARIPLLGRHTFSTEEILSLIKKLNPGNSVIIHLDVLNHCTEDRNHVKALIDLANLSSNVIFPLPGEEYSFELL